MRKHAIDLLFVIVIGLIFLAVFKYMSIESVIILIGVSIGQLMLKID